MGTAFALASVEPTRERERMARLRERLWRGMAYSAGYAATASRRAACRTSSMSPFEGVEGESLLAALEARIAVSTGSACTSAQREPSYVLRALGRDDRLAESSLRFSLGRYSSDSDIDTAVDAVTQAVRRLRGISGA